MTSGSTPRRMQNAIVISAAAPWAEPPQAQARAVFRVTTHRQATCPRFLRCRQVVQAARLRLIGMQDREAPHLEVGR